MKSIIAGYGEIGKALAKILSEYYNIEIIDIDKTKAPKSSVSLGTDILHICFPYSNKFKKYVKKYQRHHQPQYTVIHSTVPIGTNKSLRSISSPVRGKHPNLEEGIRAFPKFLGGPKASEVADYFRRAGIQVILYDKSETAEAAKLWDTTYYLECIRFAQRVKKYCDKNNLNFHEVYTIPNQTYNEGYTELGMPEVVRPVLQPIMEEVGGHCLLPNEELLNENGI